MFGLGTGTFECERLSDGTATAELTVACVSRLATTLKAEYAAALQAIEVAGTPVQTFAEQKGAVAE